MIWLFFYIHLNFYFKENIFLEIFNFDFYKKFLCNIWERKNVNTNSLLSNLLINIITYSSQKYQYKYCSQFCIRFKKRNVMILLSKWCLYSHKYVRVCVCKTSEGLYIVPTVDLFQKIQFTKSKFIHLSTCLQWNSNKTNKLNTW